MSTDFVAICPPQWVAMIRPYLQRAQEFQGKQPLVAYFLKTHVAFLCLKQRSASAGNKEGKEFLMKLLHELEQDKVTLQQDLEKSDGRTVLTRYALMLFSKADDLERAGQANDQVVKLFYTSSLLLEATGQYLEGELDPLAQEKRKYARFVATKMKKCIEQGLPYVSHNQLECDNEDEGAQVPPPAPSVPSKGYACMPSADYPPPASVAPPAVQTFQPQPFPPQPQQPVVAPSQQLTFVPAQPMPVAPPQSSYPGSSSYVAPVTGGYAPNFDAMIDAQKYCKQAVSALQFYDFENAKKQLVTALNILNGVKA